MKVTWLRLRHPHLDFDVDVSLTEYEGRWLTVAILADRGVSQPDRLAMPSLLGPR